MGDRSRAAAGFGRRRLLTTGLGALGVAGVGGVPGGARAEKARGGGDVLAAPVGGSSEPSAIPWLDKNGSHNQSPGPGMDPSNIFHFKGRIARANDFEGTGKDGKGSPLPWGAPSTDFSFIDATYWPTNRIERRGIFSHL
ncbi:hypothetical protein [Anaeromyxobacter terrae]|uniref:hypothetical protein n=1 Tax=Anaeromyxobacter terrae TaxID=2925406 RepID=UPI001F59EFB6|nr:hypothetical protein [Anaeromyxobacter sp. SG22]